MIKKIKQIYLKVRIKENQEENKSPFSASDTSKLELLYFEAAPQLSLFKEQVEGSFFIYQNQHFSAHVMDVFHPPQSSVLS